MENTIGNILKLWRQQRRYSQLSLALELGVSSKHISFIETGRSIPSKEMILKISNFLVMPKSEINRALYSAGYAPIYSELLSSDASLKPVFEAVDKMIVSHMPYPAYVLNQSWDLINANDSAIKLLSDLGYSEYTNMLEALISDDAKKSKIINYTEAISSVIARLKLEISMLGSHERLQEYETLLSERLNEGSEIGLSDEVVLSTKFKLNEYELNFFSFFAQLGTVQDVIVSEYKVELMFPVDTVTKEYYEKSCEKT